MTGGDNAYFSSISDVAKKLGLPSHVLRFWERQFPAFIKPTTGAGGRRYYRASDVSTLEKIKDLLYRQGYTIRGVKKLLAAGGGAMVSSAARETAAPAPRAVGTDEIDQAVELLLSASLALESAQE
ncbi:MAG: MerR family transcriptional regulator [Rickettsiales bacterium]|jgi:DNA-binding transcriptional MerR regulator|nr:MerR family transcriptional regulator [Rickettsiales bacterium]